MGSVTTLVIAVVSITATALPTAKNVVIIVADDLGYADLGYTGSGIKTPVLDHLANNGVKLKAFYVQRACSPTRACIMSGRYNFRYGMQSGVLETGQAFGLDLHETLIPQALRQAAALVGNVAGASVRLPFSPSAVVAEAALACGSNASHVGVNCGGGGLPGKHPVNGSNGDAGKCCNNCQADPSCKVWTVYDSKCYLKTSDCQPTTSPHSISGGSLPPPAPPSPPSPPPPTPPTPAPPPCPADPRTAGSWATHAIGKWHLGYYQWAYTPTFRGFDSYLGYLTGGETYFTHMSFGKGLYDLRREACPKCGDNCSWPEWRANGEYSAFTFTNEAVSVINMHAPQQRLFMYLAYQNVHSPTQVPDSYVAPYSALAEPRRTFAGMLAALDEGVGNVTAALKAKGLWDETVIWFQTDNGAPTPSCGGAQGGQNWPYRGGKCSCWEGGLRGTAFVYSPLLPPAVVGKETFSIMHAVDVLPTLVAAATGAEGHAALAGWLAAEGRPLDGVSQWGVIAGGDVTAAARTEVMLEADPHSLPLERQYCGDQHGSGPGTGYYAFRRGQWKIILGDPAAGFGDDGVYCTGAPCPFIGWSGNATNRPNLTASSVQLFDVVLDPAEATNLATQKPTLTKTLIAAMLAYNATSVPAYVCGETHNSDIYGDGALWPWNGTGPVVN